MRPSGSFPTTNGTGPLNGSTPNRAGRESPWSWEVEAARLTQGASDAVPVYRAGALFGTVRQPSLTIEDVALRVNRRF